MIKSNFTNLGMPCKIEAFINYRKKKREWEEIEARQREGFSQPITS
jgi:hypothetical protein